MPDVPHTPPAALARVPETLRSELDVRPTLREGGEPFAEIMHAASEVPPGGALCLRATFKPVPLFGVMRMRGFDTWVERGEDDDWVVWFYKRT